MNKLRIYQTIHDIACRLQQEGMTYTRADLAYAPNVGQTKHSPRWPLHFCSNSSRLVEMLLQFAATHRSPSKCSCNLQQLIEARRNAPAICSGSSSPVEMLLQFAAAHRSPSKCSCNLQQLIEARRNAPAICSGSSRPVDKFLQKCSGFREGKSEAILISSP